MHPRYSGIQGLNLATPATRQPGCRQTRSKAATLADIRKVTKRPFYTPPSWQAGLDAAETWTVLRVSNCSNPTAPDTSHSYPRGTKKC